MSKKPPTSSCASHVSIAIQLLVNVHWVNIEMCWVQQRWKRSHAPLIFTRF